MAKVAIFVEGLTELLFVKRLVVEMAGASNVGINEQRRRGGGYITLSVARQPGVRHEVLIIDCCGDNAVLSAIRERYSGLTGAGYNVVIGIRDLYPSTHQDLPKIRQAISTVIPSGGPPVHIVIAVAEVEAWFVQEDSHYQKISKLLTVASIKASTGYDVAVDVAENLPHPALKLDQIYRVAGKRYRKAKASITRTVDSLDLLSMYIDKRPLMPSFSQLATEIEAFLQLP